MKEINEDGDSACPTSPEMNTDKRTGEMSKCNKDRGEKKQVFCGICRADFFSLSSLKDHLRDMHVVQTDTKNFSCVSCNQSYKTLGTAVNHIHQKHTKENITRCGKCGVKFARPRAVSANYRMPNKSERHCKKCRNGFRESEMDTDEVMRELKDLTSETKKYASKQPKEVPIKEETEPGKCDKEIIEKEPENIGCEYCRFSFPSARGLERHIRLSHLGKGLRPHACDKCGKKFLLKQYLVAHAAAAHAPKQHRCGVCEVDFPTQRKLVAHHNQKHTVGRPHTCAVCDKTFKTRRSLRSHCRKHTERYPCDVCGREFSDRGYLGVHRRTHTGERPYPCPGCDKRFSTTRHLKTHFRIHSGERPYACETCGRAFRRREHLKTHVRVHTGEKPYVCDICRRGFSQKWVMYTHRRIHTGERPFECEVCHKGFIYKSQMKTHQLSHVLESVECTSDNPTG